MRLLIDNALSPLVSQRLAQAGHAALHVRDVGMAAASDAEILAFAEEQDRVVISADTDFGALLTLRCRPHPSFILFRGGVERHPEAQASILVRELPRLEEHLSAGAIVVITRDRVRVRRLSSSTE